MGKAPLSSCLTSILIAQSSTQLSFTLPLLYQTRTLFSEPKTAIRFAATGSNAHSHGKCRRSFSTSVQCQRSRHNAYDASRIPRGRLSRASRYRAGRTKSDPISFINLDPMRPTDPSSIIEDQLQHEFSRPSTVTPSEQAVFDRLLDDLPASENYDEDILDEDILDPDEPSYAEVSLDSIFEAAINELRAREKNNEEEKLRKMYLSLSLPRERALDSLVLGGEETLSANSMRYFKRPEISRSSLKTEVGDEEERARLEVACDDHRDMVMGMFDGANSDAEIWRVLEEEVFSLITQLEEHIKLVEKAKKRRPTAAEQMAALEGKDMADIKLEKRRTTKKKEAAASTVKFTETKAFPANNLLAILRRNYAEYCLYAHRLLRRKHPTSPYGPQILATIKRRGPISYVLGVTTDIYNEVLFYQWTQFSDLHGMADTIEEMMNQGIEGNQVTVALIKGIAKERRMGRRVFSPPVMRRWWTMRGTVEGWKRMIDLFGKIVGELAESTASSVDETSGETGETETSTT